MHRDRDLLERFARHGAEEAFAEVVRRHLDLVYGTALRHLRGNLSRTTEVTQAVFAALASQAGELAGQPRPADWLYRTTRLAAAAAVRTEPLRPAPESRPPSQHPLPVAAAGDAPTGLTAGLLHDALAEIPAADREIVLLRFFGGHPPATIGRLLGVSEDTARGQLAQAVEHARGRLADRGVNLPATTLHTVLANEYVAAPVDLASEVVAGALTAAAALRPPAGMATGRSALRFAARLAPWLAASAAVVALLFAYRHDRTARQLERELARQRQETERLAASLAASESEAGAAAAQVRELSAKLVEIVSRPPPAPAPPAPAAAPSPVPRAAPARAESAPDPRPGRTARLAQLKPLLEAGRPIKGAVVVLVEGRPAPRPVEFVLGRELRLEGADDGTYTVLPTLNTDGTIRYQISILRRDPATGIERAEPLPPVIQAPWDPFTVGGPGGRAFAFDPEDPAP